MQNKFERLITDDGNIPGNIKSITRKIKEQVENFFKKQDDEWIREVFKRNTKGQRAISAEGFEAAIKELGIKMDEHDVRDFFQSLDLNGNGALDLQEFRRCISHTSELEHWAGTLPLAQLLASCFPIAEDGRGGAVRNLCRLGEAEVAAAIRAFADGAGRLVTARLAELRRGFEELGQRAAAAASGAGSKF